MNDTTRIYIITLANIATVAIMLAWLSHSGVDIAASSLAENADNIWFMFDFLGFLTMSFAVNAGILLYPTKRQSTLRKIIRLLDEYKASKPANKSYRKRIA
jgi:hypothetical protein